MKQCWQNPAYTPPPVSLLLGEAGTQIMTAIIMMMMAMLLLGDDDGDTDDGGDGAAADGDDGGDSDKAETPILWPPGVKSWLIEKDPDAGKDWKQEEKGTTEDEMIR